MPKRNPRERPKRNLVKMLECLWCTFPISLLFLKLHLATLSFVVACLKVLQQHQALKSVLVVQMFGFVTVLKLRDGVGLA